MPDVVRASGVLLIDGRLKWSCGIVDMLLSWFGAGIGPMNSWATGESIMGVLNWLLGNMFMSFDIMLSESSMSIDMFKPFG
jgi:hypothetical protein